MISISRYFYYMFLLILFTVLTYLEEGFHLLVTINDENEVDVFLRSVDWGISMEITVKIFGLSNMNTLMFIHHQLK